MAGTIRIQDTGETFTFDTTLTESRAFAATITDHPVDAGLNTADHRQEKPITLSVTARVTESPFPEQQINTNASVAAVRLAATQTEPVIVQQPPLEGPDRIEYARDFLLRASRAGLLTWVGVKYGTVQNLMIENITFDVVRSGHLDFRLSLKEVRIAQAARVEVPAEYVPKPVVQEEEDVCKQEPEDPEPDPDPPPPEEPETYNERRPPRTGLAQAADAFRVLQTPAP